MKDNELERRIENGRFKTKLTLVDIRLTRWRLAGCVWFTSAGFSVRLVYSIRTMVEKRQNGLKIRDGNDEGAYG